MKFKRTFTLIEIIVVISLMSLMMTVIIPFGKSLLGDLKKNSELESFKLVIHEMQLEALLKGEKVVFKLNQNNKNLSLRVFFEKDLLAVKEFNFYHLLLLNDDELVLSFHPTFRTEKVESLVVQDLKGKKFAIKF